MTNAVPAPGVPDIALAAPAKPSTATSARAALWAHFRNLALVVSFLAALLTLSDRYLPSELVVAAESDGSELANDGETEASVIQVKLTVRYEVQYRDTAGELAEGRSRGQGAIPAHRGVKRLVACEAILQMADERRGDLLRHGDWIRLPTDAGVDLIVKAWKIPDDLAHDKSRFIDEMGERLIRPECLGYGVATGEYQPEPIPETVRSG